MADLIFGFSTGDNSEHESGHGDSHSGFFNPFGMGNTFSMDDLGQIFTQLGKIFSDPKNITEPQAGSSTSPINYDLAHQVALKAIGSVEQISAATTTAMRDALRLADTWLDGICALPAGITDTAVWTPSEWVDNTLPVWKRLCDPMATQVGAVWTAALPEEAKDIASPLLSVMSQMGGVTFGSQLGQALGKISREVLTSTDLGLPLGPLGLGVLMPGAIEDLAQGLEQPRSELVMLLAAREAAHHRLFTHIPWLPHQLLSTIEAYAAGMDMDLQGMENLAHDFNPALLSDPSSMEELLQRGVFEPKPTPEQLVALERLETLLALIEGWVRTVVSLALSERIPGTSALSEILLRRRAAGGPAEQTFSSLVGLELRPRRLREAAQLWERLTDAVGMDRRDQLWQHPDLLPDAEALNSPASFIDRVISNSTSDVDSVIDQAIKEFERNQDQPPSSEDSL